jgi:hypothetical protein
MQQTACNMQHRKWTCNTRHGTGKMQHTTCNAHHATHDMVQATCNAQHATHNMVRATCDMRHATCGIVAVLLAGLLLLPSGLFNFGDRRLCHHRLNTHARRPHATALIHETGGPFCACGTTPRGVRRCAFPCWSGPRRLQGPLRAVGARRKRHRRRIDGRRGGVLGVSACSGGVRARDGGAAGGRLARGRTASGILILATALGSELGLSESGVTPCHNAAAARSQYRGGTARRPGGLACHCQRLPGRAHVPMIGRAGHTRLGTRPSVRRGRIPEI